jgi:hypothetical protein
MMPVPRHAIHEKPIAGVAGKRRTAGGGCCAWRAACGRLMDREMAHSQAPLDPPGVCEWIISRSMRAKRRHAQQPQRAPRSACSATRRTLRLVSWRRWCAARRFRRPPTLRT